MKITFVGAGYVGLVSGACLSDFGHEVTCIDTNPEKIELLSRGKSPIYEPGLEPLLQKGIGLKRLSFTTDWNQAIPEADVVFIAVGTPSSRRGDGYADLSYVYSAARTLAPLLKGYTVVVNKSTVPVGTAREVSRIIKEVNPSTDIDVASNPEFLREGAAIYDFTHPDRIVIGADSERAQEKLKEVYRPLYLANTPFVATNPETAELTKYASNAFLATKISFVNEMANLCEAVGAHVGDLVHGLGLDKRIGPKFLHPGPGYGGSCFPKDTLSLVRIAQEHGAPTRIVETVVEVNNAQKARMVRKIRQALGGNESGKTLAVLGLTFKPETDDLREAPAFSILPPLMEKGLRIRAHDPVGMIEAKRLLPEIFYCGNPYEACEEADAVCLMTEWNQYRALDLERVKSKMRQPIFIDLRNVYTPEIMKQAGFYYVSIGKKDVMTLLESQWPQKKEKRGSL
ncbi:MAG: UDP-glucose/GDP-mannose dehydrogenase family protein [Deltaproteobacteria bacterium]|nr:UDP-glucose/GDP-mannose dehydrogenase family protein [Deltaproteobacteria bacterium]